MTKSAPFSIRLPADTDELITAEARRTDRSKGSVVASLAEEALKCRLFPGIAFRGHDWDRRPWIIGTALDVWQVVRAREDHASDEEIVASSDLTEGQVRLAMAYYARFPAEIDHAIAEDRRGVEDLLAQHPTIDVVSFE